ncbi:MAG: hypothetical protein KF823_13025 [Xanthomonadales bacterium]|nr:hypothetical protein [Xanthomonadales bacterium]
MSRLLLSVLSLCLAVWHLPSTAADGDRLIGFGTEAQFPGFGFYPGPYGGSEFDRVVTLAEGAQQRLYVFASVRVAPNQFRALVYRLLPDGWFDFDFGNDGFITLAPPCPEGSLTHAAIDGQQRPWLLFSGCGDFELYRLTAAGLADTSLLGSGRLSIPFNLGGDNLDLPRRMSFTADGHVAVAGIVGSATGRRLGLALFTAQGGPVPGFGNAGRANFALPKPVDHIGAIHAMPDGRLVASGDLWSGDDILNRLQFVVRVQPSGSGDIGFGNHAPGISLLNLPVATGSDPAYGGGITYDSLLERDGSLIQIGSWHNANAPHLKSEFLLVRWRPDGQPDASFGPAGHRTYGLNQGGDPNAPGYNTDHGRTLLRQGNGRYLLAGTSTNPDNRTELALLRLRRDFSPDPSFGVGGWVTDRIEVGGTGGMQPVTQLLRSGSLITALTVRVANSALVATLRGARNDLLFADTFD